VQKYMSRISGPLLDRIDLQVEIMPVAFDEISSAAKGESSAAIRQRVVTARAIQARRYADEPGVHCNAQMTPRLLSRHVSLDSKAMAMLKRAMEKFDMSARAYDRILKVARTIADLDGSEAVNAAHVNEAISYRNLDRSTWGVTIPKSL
jgi:magnesium chelatase family protein